MGFSGSSFIVKYHRSLLHKKSYFKSRELAHVPSNLEKAKRKQFSQDTLRRIKKNQRKNILKSIAWGVILLALTYLSIWYLFF